jgi:4'-phosphopantetheinyl transferase EntD
MDAGGSPLIAAWLAEMLPPGVIASELPGAGNPEQLLPEERACVRDAWPERQRQFAAGRQCARRALAEFGIHAFPLLIGPDRRPLWPPSMVGSITHTADYCAAAVWKPGSRASLGLDAEHVGEVVARLWPSIATPAELSWLATLPPDRAGRAAALIFAAKEAFYKCQFGLTREPLEFHAVRIELTTSDTIEQRGGFRVRPLRGIELLRCVPEPLNGRFCFREQRVLAAMAVQAGPLGS